MSDVVEMEWREGNYSGRATSGEWLTFSEGWEVIDGPADFAPCAAMRGDGHVCMAQQNHEHPHVVCNPRSSRWDVERVVGVRRRSMQKVT